MRAVVGVSIVIESLEGKYKLSQNRSDADIDGVIDGLARHAPHSAHTEAMAKLVAERRPLR